MNANIPESDWRRFKEVHAKLLERYCDRILEEVAAASRNTKGTAHERYLKVYKLIKERDKQLANAFDDFRRSTAVLQLGIMRRMKLLTDEELGLFSEQTRIHVEAIASL
ncbi:MAG: peptide ABC transporter substrate-binding protein [Verrucomicrobia bacterium]|nr:MAG: peptide ABC transporter substrate-binding protein [Verrucomicrobiota bacterium]